MKKRFITATVLILTLVPLLFFSAKSIVVKRIFEVLLMFIALGAEIELLNMYDKSKKIHLWLKILTIIMTFVLYFSIVSWFSYYFSYNIFSEEHHMPLIGVLMKNMHLAELVNPFFGLFIIFIVYMSILVIYSEILAKKNKDSENPVDFKGSDISRLFLSILYVSLCVSAFTILFSFGVRFVVYLLIITVFTDIFALVFGMKFGKHKMAPTVSPKKTWEGAIGGTLTAVVVGTLFLMFYHSFSGIFHETKIEFFDGIFGFSDFGTFGKIVFSVILTTFLSVCSQIGDLVASKLKRDYGIKDYSNIFPGHGGILDRFDSAFFASLIFLLILFFAIVYF